MNEHEALHVVLVQSFETQAGGDQLLSDTERHEASRAALEAVGPAGTPDAFIAARAQDASRSLCRQVPQLDKILQRDTWHSAWLGLAIAIGLLLGITADVFGSGRQLNLLAPPAWLVILWNLGVYCLLASRLIGSTPRQKPSVAGWVASATRELRAFQLGRLLKPFSTSSPQSGALAAFSSAWGKASLPLATRRLLVLLHVASAAVAVALIIGMYLRGLVFDYRVAWGSTFLDTESVRALLAFLLAPALWLSGIQLPDVAQMEALRETSGLAREQATAAPWIHLYAIMLMLIVVLPRVVLAYWNHCQVRSLCKHFPLSLDEQYYRNLMRIQRGETTRVYVLPYAQLLAVGAEQVLRRTLEQAFDNSPQIDIAASTPQGAEDALSSVPTSLAQATHLVVLFDMTATPESEYHGAFLSALAAAMPTPILVVVNEASFAARFKDYPHRLVERRESWTRFLQSVKKNPVFVDLASPQMASHVSALRSSINDLTVP